MVRRTRLDKSAEYIRMCEEAKEIQKDIPDFDDGDFYYQYPGEGVYAWGGKWSRVGGVYIAGVDMWPSSDTKVVWLPRQDQLQETYYRMDIQLDYRVITDMNGFIKENLEYVKQFTSLEQLWLAFLMFRKYGKVWDEEKEEWVNQNV